MTHQFPLRRVRALLALFIVGLFVSGLTIWPAAAELRFALSVVPEGGAVRAWLQRVYDAYTEVGRGSGLLLYGYDWLAFAHILFAGLFIGPWLDPLRNRWIIGFGIIACVLIFPLAFIAGPLRGIPLWWCFVDSSFGFFGGALLIPCYRAVCRAES